MISKVELQYVNKYARQVPYPGDNYAMDVMDKLIKAFNLYKDKYQDKTYSLILSNGEEFEFAILPKNLCHMLGIDYKNIISEPMLETRENVLDMRFNDQVTSYDLLMKILDKADEVIKNDSIKSNYKLLNYYRILIKCSIFMKLSDFKSFNFGFINFDKMILFNSTEKVFKPNSTKIIFTPSDDALIPYYMMGMVHDNIDNIFIPETLFASPEYVDFFINQELVLPIQLLINDNDNFSKIIATPEEKLNILKMYKIYYSKL